MWKRALWYCAPLACALAGPQVAVAQADAPEAQAVSPVTLAEMRARDRFAPPTQELAAWEAFVSAQSDASPLERAETLTGLTIAHF